jgi:MtrB/PioB family decaheme-associated outer membrane protein
MNKCSTTLSFAVASVLLAAGAASAQEASAPAATDTSSWTCSKCPFEKGYQAGVEAGAGYVSDDSAKFGDYTGMDQKGGYLLASADGKATYESGYSLSYDLRDLGLDSRSVRLDGGKQGAYDFSLFYDRVPHSIADTAQSVYDGTGSRSQSLPADWVRAGSTAGMTALDSSLHRADVGFDRDRYGAAGSYWFGGKLLLSLDYRRDDRDGNRPTFGSFGSVSTQMLRPISDTTDRINATARYEGSKWFAQVGYYASIFDNKAESVRWDNPFNSPVPGGTEGRMALEPSNDYHEIALSAGMHGLPWNTVLGLSASTGEGTQNTSFVPYTINSSILTDALPLANLGGKVKVNRAEFTASSRPLDRLRLRGSVAWDERKDDSKQAYFTSIVHTDLFLLDEDRLNPTYGYERLRARGSADFDVYNDLTIGAGGEYKKLDRKGTAQAVSSEETLDGWGRVQYRPNGYLGVVIKGGAERRDPQQYDMTVAADNGDNPLMRKYYLAYRYRSYGDLLTNVALGTLPLTLSGNVFYADDRYLQSHLGLIGGINRRYGADLTWAMNEKVSSYLSVGRNHVTSKTLGSSTFAAADWRGDVDDDYATYGVGARAHITDKLDANFDYTFGDGQSDTKIVGTSAGAFPTVTTRLHSAKAAVTYKFSERTDFVFGWRYEKLNTNDWALQGIDPATLPTVLALGIDPYNYEVHYVTATVRYTFGPPKGEKAAD